MSFIHKAAGFVHAKWQQPENKYPLIFTIMTALLLASLKLTLMPILVFTALTAMTSYAGVLIAKALIDLYRDFRQTMRALNQTLLETAKHTKNVAKHLDESILEVKGDTRKLLQSAEGDLNKISKETQALLQSTRADLDTLTAESQELIQGIDASKARCEKKLNDNMDSLCTDARAGVAKFTPRLERLTDEFERTATHIRSTTEVANGGMQAASTLLAPVSYTANTFRSLGTWLSSRSTATSTNTPSVVQSEQVQERTSTEEAPKPAEAKSPPPKRRRRRY